MSCYHIRGGRPLEGRLTVQGAKNSALPILAATLLAPGESVIENCPHLSDVDAALAILTGLGCRVWRRTPWGWMPPPSPGRRYHGN